MTYLFTLLPKNFHIICKFVKIDHVKAGVVNLLLVTGQMSSVQLFGGPEFSLIL